MKILGIILLLIGIIWAIVLLPVLFLGTNYPTASLVASIFCGSDSSIAAETMAVETSRGTRFLGSMECVNNTTGETSDLTMMYFIISLVPGVVLGTIGVALMNAGNMLGGFGGMKELSEIYKVPEVKAQLDPLMNDLKAGRISYEDYNEQSKVIIENYKARQATS